MCRRPCVFADHSFEEFRAFKLLYNTLYRVSKRTVPFIFKLATNLLLEFVSSHVYSQHEVVNDCKSTVPFKFMQLKCILTPIWN